MDVLRRRWLHWLDVPLDDLLVELLKTFLDLGDVDILAPGLLALSRRLLVLLGPLGVARKGAEDGHGRRAEECGGGEVVVVG